MALLRPRRRPTPAPARTVSTACSHPADALTSSRAGTLGRAWVQTCECGQQWTVRP